MSSAAYEIADIAAKFGGEDQDGLRERLKHLVSRSYIQGRINALEDLQIIHPDQLKGAIKKRLKDNKGKLEAYL